MRDLSDNKYIISVDKSVLGMSIFDGVLPRKNVNDNEMLSIVRDFLARMKFNVHSVGYKYLSRLLYVYLVSDCYSQDDAVVQIAKAYGVSQDFLVENTAAVIERNVDFPSLASTLLGISQNKISASLTDTVDILGAIFHIYFQQVECDQCVMPQININFLQVLDYVRRTSKEN